MKQIFTVLVAVTITVNVFAQSSEKMSYQAIVRDGSNNLIVSAAVGVQISILQGSASGTAVYVETQTPTSNANGLISFEIGNGTTVSGDFSIIDWTKGPYFIKTETDPTGGSTYTITGTSQLLSVPFALHAKTAETVTGKITEIDPVFTSSHAANITATDLTNLSNLKGTNTGDQDISLIATNTQAIKDTALQIRADIPDVLIGTQTGQIQYWNGSEWLAVAAGNEGQILTFTGGMPKWATAAITVAGSTDAYNPITNKIWMSYNLGASQVAYTSNNEYAYGDLFQWGRGADGHHYRTSGTTTTMSSSNTPGHGNFILVSASPYNWRSPQNDNLWQGKLGTNNPCPSGYRLPTEVEWEAERASWSSSNSAGAFASPLKLTVAGTRGSINGSLYYAGSGGHYWSSNISGTNSRRMDFNSTNAGMTNAHRAAGSSIRCIKD